MPCRSRAVVVSAVIVAGCGSKPAPPPAVVVPPPASSPATLPPAGEPPPGSSEGALGDELFMEVRGDDLELRFEGGCLTEPLVPAVYLTTWADDPHLLFCASAGDADSAWIYLAGRMAGAGTSYGARAQFEHPDTGETYFSTDGGGVSVQVSSLGEVGGIAEGSYTAELTTDSIAPDPEAMLTIAGRFRLRRTPDSSTTVP